MPANSVDSQGLKNTNRFRFVAIARLLGVLEPDTAKRLLRELPQLRGEELESTEFVLQEFLQRKILSREELQLIRDFSDALARDVEITLEYGAEIEAATDTRDDHAEQGQPLSDSDSPNDADMDKESYEDFDDLAGPLEEAVTRAKAREEDKRNSARHNEDDPARREARRTRARQSRGRDPMDRVLFESWQESWQSRLTHFLRDTPDQLVSGLPVLAGGLFKHAKANPKVSIPVAAAVLAGLGWLLFWPATSEPKRTTLSQAGTTVNSASQRDAATAPQAEASPSNGSRPPAAMDSLANAPESDDGSVPTADRTDNDQQASGNLVTLAAPRADDVADATGSAAERTEDSEARLTEAPTPESPSTESPIRLAGNIDDPMSASVKSQLQSRRDLNASEPDEESVVDTEDPVRVTAIPSQRQVEQSRAADLLLGQVQPSATLWVDIASAIQTENWDLAAKRLRAGQEGGLDKQEAVEALAAVLLATQAPEAGEEILTHILPANAEYSELRESLFASWLWHADEDERSTVLAWLATKGELGGTDSRWKAWMHVRQGDWSAGKELEQLTADQLSSGDLLFRAAARLRTGEAEQARADVDALTAMLAGRPTRLSPSADSTEIIEFLVAPIIGRAADKLAAALQKAP